MYPQSLYLDQLRKRLNPPDMNFDGKVNLYDLAKFVDNWLRINCQDCGHADFNGDRRVDFEDFVIFAQNWLE